MAKDKNKKRKVGLKTKRLSVKRKSRPNNNEELNSHVHANSGETERIAGRHSRMQAGKAPGNLDESDIRVGDEEVLTKDPEDFNQIDEPEQGTDPDIDTDSDTDTDTDSDS